jgi:hypothetical protein
MNRNKGLHYHIHWTRKTLDWERFDTSADAEASARKLALPGETFTVEEHSESCPQCMKFMKMVSGRDSNEAST